MDGLARPAISPGGMSFFNIAGDPMTDAVRFWCKFIASGSRFADEDMYSDAAQSLIKTQTHFEPSSSVDSLVDLVASRWWTREGQARGDTTCVGERVFAMDCTKTSGAD